MTDTLNPTTDAAAASAIDRPAAEIVADLTLEEKASLTSGADFWTTKPVERVGLPAIMLTDGPHGVRKQREGGDHLGIGDSVPATCFPPAVALGSSFDPALLERVGVALGEESLAEGVGVLLGPGINIKRSPLCGRNFEYLSEDPLRVGRARLRARARPAVAGRRAPRSSTSPPTTRRPTACASRPTSTSARCARSTCAASSASWRASSRGPSCARTTGSTACTPPRTRGCSTGCCVTSGASTGLVVSDWGAVERPRHRSRRRPRPRDAVERRPHRRRTRRRGARRLARRVACSTRPRGVRSSSC